MLLMNIRSQIRGWEGVKYGDWRRPNGWPRGVLLAVGNEVGPVLRVGDRGSAKRP